MTGNNTRKKGVGVSLDEELIQVIDDARGYESFSSFVNRTLRKALGMSEA